jgi:PAS domain S-box-containing protein
MGNSADEKKTKAQLIHELATLRQQVADLTALMQSTTSEPDFYQIFDQVPVGTAIAQLDGQLLHVNRALCQTLGYSAAAPCPASMCAMIHPDDWQQVSTALNQLASDPSSCQIESRCLTQTGQSLHCLLQIGCWLDAQGNPPRLIIQMVNVSDRPLHSHWLESDERYALATQAGQVGVWDWNLLTNEAYIDPNLKAMLGYTDEELSNQIADWRGLVHPEDLERVTTAINDCLTQKTPEYSVEYRMQHKNGAVHWFLAHGSILYDRQGNPYRMIGTRTDITDRKQAEVALRESEERFRYMANSAPVLLWMSDLEAQCTFVNQSWLDFTGRTLADELGDGWLEPIHPEEVQHSQDRLRAAFSAHQRFQIEYRYRQANGEYRWVLNTGIPRLLPDGNVTGYIGSCVDITDRKQAEEMIRAFAIRFSRIFHSTPDAIAITSLANGQYLDINTSFTEVLGYSRKEVLGRTPLELGIWVNASDYATARQRLHDEGMFYNLEFDFRTQSGEIKTLLISAEISQLDGEACVLAVCKDITERKQAEIALQRMVERERFITTLAQNIRQTLDLGEILTTTVEEVRQFLQVDRVLIYRFNPGWSGTIVAESIEHEALSLVNRTIYDPCFEAIMLDAYQQGHIHTINDIFVASLQPCYVEMLCQLQVRAVLAIPILVRQDLWGLLVAHQCTAPREWQQVNAHLLQQLSIQLAIGIQQSQLYQAVQQLNDDLEHQVEVRTAQLQQVLNFEALLQRITDKVRDTLDEHQILRTAVEELGQGLEVDCCDAALYDSIQKTVTICYESTRSGMPLVEGLSVRIDDMPDLYAQILEGQSVQFCFTSLSPLTIRGVDHQSTLLICPLMDEQGVFGDLWLFKPQQDSFSTLEIRLVQQVANQCAIALRQSRLYQTAQAQVEELERLNRLKDDFLSTVSHELRTPMSSIKMATQMLEINLTQLGLLSAESNAGSNPVSQYFQILQEECQREITLINNLLDLSRLNAETEPLVLNTIALQIWIPHIIEPLEPRIQNRQLQLQLDMMADLPPLTTDLSYLERILTELLSNACKYAPVGERLIVSARIVPDQQTSILPGRPPTPHPSVWISVTNSGTEIPISEQERIFDKFYRIPSDDPWKHSGTGLGLALVKRFAERLGGAVFVESTANRTTFTLVLPLVLPMG